MISVSPRIPAASRDRQPRGVMRMDSARMASGMPGVSRSTTALVASGVMSRLEKPVPPVEFIDWLFTRNRLHQVRNEQTLELFRQTVERWAGRAITNEEIAAAGAICNENRQALREMAALRRCAQPRITGSEALVIIGSAFFMERSAHTALVRQVVTDAQSWPVLHGPRVFFTGSNQEDLSLIHI